MGVCLNFKVLFQIPCTITIRIYPQTESKPFWLDQSANALGHIFCPLEGGNNHGALFLRQSALMVIQGHYTQNFTYKTI